MITTPIMGFSYGLPLLYYNRLQVQDKEVALTVIEIMSIVGLPYTLKFVWTPFLGRQTKLGLTDPGSHPWVVVAASLPVTLVHHRILLCMPTEEKIFLITSWDWVLLFILNINGCLIGMLLASSGGFILSDNGCLYASRHFHNVVCFRA